MRAALMPVFALSLISMSCVSAPRVSQDKAFNYSCVFSGMSSSKPVIVNSRVERYTKNFGPISSSERNGEWEFEIIASRDWINELMHGFRDSAYDSYRKPSVPWWTPTRNDYNAYEMTYSSFPAAHLYVEKHPKDERRIHAYIQRH